MDSENKEHEQCDGCGNPPFPDKTLSICSRCKNAKYHNRECQRRHYHTHIRTCRAQTTSETLPATNPKEMDANTTALITCQMSEQKGRCIIATRAIDKWQRIVDKAETLVPPLLNLNNRRRRCSLCFQKLPRDTSFEFNESIIHFHCSSSCCANDKFWEWEERASKIVPGGQVPTPTILLVTRILRQLILQYDLNLSLHDQTSTMFRQISELLSNFHKLNYQEKENCEAIAHLSVLLLSRPFPSESLDFMRNNSVSIEDLFGMVYVTELVSKITMNAFNISSGEGVAIGTGLYPSVAMANHCCQPNAIQTFHMSNATPPRLALTACAPVKVS